MNRYLFILGRKSELAFFELETVLTRYLRKRTFKLKNYNQHAILQLENKLDTDQLISFLGGTIKIISLFKTSSEKSIISDLVEFLRIKNVDNSKLLFGISIIGNSEKQLQKLLSKQLKKQLTKVGINSRYILTENSAQLTSAQVSLHGLFELYLIYGKDKIEIGQTVAVQDFQGFSYRDYQRPFISPEEGMLPPKIARMLVNLALPNNYENKWLYDPFCGTGTVAMEALILGVNTLSSDISQEKVEGTKRNLSWLSSLVKNSAKWEVFQTDATKASSKLSRQVDCIVSEPFLGSTRLGNKNIKNIIKGLNKLYLGALKNWNKLLVDNGKVVIIIPEITSGLNKLKATLAIDRCEKLGYTLVAGPFDYSREKAQVKRLIFILEKN